MEAKEAELLEIITDSDVAKILNVSVSTVRRNARLGPLRAGPGKLDLRLADPIYIGKTRRWDKARVLAVINNI